MLIVGSRPRDIVHSETNQYTRRKNHCESKNVYVVQYEHFCQKKIISFYTNILGIFVLSVLNNEQYISIVLIFTLNPLFL